jgi:flagellar protein FliL
MAEKQDLELGEAAKGGGKKKLIIIIAAAVLVLAIGGGAAFFLLKKPAPTEGEAGAAGTEAGEHAEEEEVPEEGAPSLRYVALAQPILANLSGAEKAHTIKLQVVYAVKTASAEEKVKKHLPLLGSELLLQLSSAPAEQLMTAEGQQAFRDQALVNARAALEREEKKPLVERILFTQFVMQ